MCFITDGIKVKASASVRAARVLTLHLSFCSAPLFQPRGLVQTGDHHLCLDKEHDRSLLKWCQVGGFSKPYISPLFWMDQPAMERWSPHWHLEECWYRSLWPESSLEVQIWWKNKRAGTWIKSGHLPYLQIQGVVMLFWGTSRNPALTPRLWWWWTYLASTCLWRSAEDDATQLSLD